ncbi:MAG: response regulator transcription factor [Phycisphaeraceae bacterium]
MTVSRAKKKISKILVVDDHPIVCDGLARLIDATADLEVCGQATGAPEAVRKFENLQPDLLIIDISLEGVSGLELIKQIKARDEGARMLVVSMHEESLYAERVLRAGAMGYMNKHEAPTKIVGAIRQVLNGHVHVSDGVADRMLHRVVRGERAPDRPAIDSLSDRELEVFQLIGRGLSTREVAETLHLSKKTVESYREQIKLKLNLKTGTELVRHAIRWQVETE